MNSAEGDVRIATYAKAAENWSNSCTVDANISKEESEIGCFVKLQYKPAVLFADAVRLKAIRCAITLPDEPGGNMLFVGLLLLSVAMSTAVSVAT